MEDSLYFNMRKSIQILHNVNLKTVKIDAVEKSVDRRFGNAAFFTSYMHSFCSNVCCRT